MERLKGSLFVLFLTVLVLGFSAPAVAAGGSVTILTPKDGAVFDSGSHIKLTYNVHLSPDGNHLHIYVDDQDPIIDREVSGCPCSLSLGRLSPGRHQVVAREATVNHDLTGVHSKVVKFTVK